MAMGENSVNKEKTPTDEPTKDKELNLKIDRLTSDKSSLCKSIITLRTSKLVEETGEHTYPTKERWELVEIIEKGNKGDIEELEKELEDAEESKKELEAEVKSKEGVAVDEQEEAPPLVGELPSQEVDKGDLEITTDPRAEAWQKAVSPEDASEELHQERVRREKK